MTLHDAKERNLITHDVATNMFVEAGAGSGKTYQLVQRLLTLVLTHNVAITNIAAITFTEKAAAELTERVRACLEKVVASNGTLQLFGDETREFGTVGVQRAQQALADLPSAAIETLHAFCLRLLRLYPLESQVPPGAELVEADISALEHHVFERLMTRAAQDEYIAQMLSSLQRTVRMDRISDIIQWVTVNWGEPAVQREYNRSVAPYDAAQHQIEWLEQFDQLIEEAREFPKLEQKLKEYVSEVHAAQAATQDPYELNLPRIKLGSNGGNKAKPLRDRCKEFVDIFYQEQAYRTFSMLLAALATDAIDFARQRIQSGKLQYQDLLYCARDLLVQHPQVASEVAEQFAYLCIDEFQDTDPIQIEIVEAIVAAGGNRPGHLFTVGDPKQSIYSFRRADVHTYMQFVHEERPVTQDARVVELNTNFRSESGVLDVINQIYQRWFTQLSADNSIEGITAVPAQDLHPRPGASDASATVLLYSKGVAEKGDDPRDFELNDVYDAIQKALEAGFSYRDIAILSLTNPSARNVIAMLREQNLPYVAEGRISLAFHEPIVVELHTVLRAIADPVDRFSRYAAARTALLGASDTDLVEESPYLQHALETLDALADAAVDAPVPQILDMVIDRLQVLQQIAEDPFNRETSLRAVEFLRAQVRQFQAEKHQGLREYLAWADAKAFGDEQIAAPVPEDNRDAIRVMTIHASKGREFPAVIVTGISAEPNNQYTNIGIDRGADNIEVRLAGDGYQTPRYQRIVEYDKASRAHEYARVVYVAMTRAQQFLAVSMQGRSRAKSSPLRAIAKELGLPLLESPQRPDPQRSANAKPTPRRAELRAAYEHQQAQIAATIEHAPERLAASRLVHDDSDKAQAILDALDFPQRDEAPLPVVPGTKGRGADFGTVVHAVMEQATDAADIEALVATAARVHGVTAPEHQAAATAMATQFWHSQPVQRAFNAEHYRELPVLGYLGEVLVEGVIDLLYRDGDAWVIADYKTDVQLPSATQNAYFAQLESYARLLEATEWGTVTRLELIIGRANQEQPVMRVRHRNS